MKSSILCVAVLVALLAPGVRAADTVQVDVRPLLNARPVTTLTAGKLVPWTKGIDGAGLRDGYLTREAARLNGDSEAKALPGDGLFPATARHPEVKLNYTNTDGTAVQARSVEGAGEFAVAVPAKRYAELMLFLSSAEGASQLSATLVYADGTRVRREVLLPDYYNPAPAGDPDLFDLAVDLAKWNDLGRMAEADHHFIHGVELHPDAQRQLVRVEVVKTAPAYLVFWGATGVTAEE